MDTDTVPAEIINELLPVPHKPTTWAELVDQVPPITFAWPGWLANGLVTMLAAESGIGKSAVALQICQSFLERHPVAGRRTLCRPHRQGALV